MPIGLLFYTPTGHTAACAIEASRVRQISPAHDGSGMIETDRDDEVLVTDTPYQKLVDDYTHLVSQAQACGC